MAVPVLELIALFTGVPLEGGDEWASTPVYDVGLAYEIATTCNPQSEHDLVDRLYDRTPLDDIPKAAVEAMALAYQRWRTVGKKAA